MSTQKRPVNLDLTKMSFPPMAIVSIMHRISGVLIFLLLPFALYLLDHSLHSSESYQALQSSLSNPFMLFMVWALLGATCFHLFAGIRHILMDFGLFEELCAARFTAYFIMVLEVIVLVALGVWLWG